MALRDGQPEPLFETPEELQQKAKDHGKTVFQYLAFLAPLGPLRSADVQLAELVVQVRDIVGKVNRRAGELGLLDYETEEVS